jgi:hypothetical protein
VIPIEGADWLCGCRLEVVVELGGIRREWRQW